MKKALATVLAATVLCGVCATGAFAAGHHGGNLGTVAAQVCSWTDGSCANHTCRNDSDGDGVCDTCGTAVTCWNDADGDGVCDVCGTDHTCRRDADGDGVCDVCGTDHTCRQDADGDGVCDVCGTDHTCRRDADGDGICDVCGATCATGTQAHHSHGTGHGHCGR